MNQVYVVEIPGKSGLMKLSFRFRDVYNRVKVYTLSYSDDNGNRTELLSDVGKNENVDVDDCGFHEVLTLVKEYDI